MKTIAILIPVFNHIAFTRKCIQKLDQLLAHRSFNNCNYRVIVIDDGSTDGTSEWLNERHPEVVVLQGNGELWWSGGINMGAEYAISELGVDYLLLWNNDIEPASDYFSQIDELLKSLGDQTIAGSKILYDDQDQKNVIWSFGGFFNPKNGSKSMLAYNKPDSPEYDRPIEVDWLAGMGTLVPVNIVQEIGWWDADTFPQYHGDSDFTFRAKTAGYRICSFPQLKLWNDKTSSGLKHGGTLKGLSRALTDRRSNSNLKDNFRFYKRHSSSVLAYRALIAYYIIYFGGFCKWKLLSLFGVKKEK
ncbi:MAG: glycosyltransferase family 2 protein [Bacteroidota bacterium]